MLDFNSENIQSSITKFERMLKTNHVYFFDAQEFEDIIVHYLGFAENALAKKALKMGLTQHPSNLELMLLQSEIFILDEFTSSLDADTESEILNNLEFLDKTIIMVSHKQSTLKKCDKIYQLGPNGLLLNE